MSDEEIVIIEKLIDKSLYKLFNSNGKFVKVVDVLENKEISIYNSINKATEDIQKRFGLKITHASICNLINGKTNVPYKGRFMCYYATDEEIKKYLDDNKAN